jgi:polysaccharide biosynthesis/export protein
MSNKILQSIKTFAKNLTSPLKYVSLVCFSLVGIAANAAEIDVNKMKQQCANITAQQRQMAKAAGYDVDSLCASIPDGMNGAPIETPTNVLPRGEMATEKDVEDSFKDLADEANLDEDKEKQSVNKEELKQFGYDLFAGVPTTFAPATDIPINSDYVIGPGDTIEIQLFGKTSSQFSLVVQRDGSVNFPDLGPISLTGLSYVEMKQLLTSRVKQQMIGVNISITMGELRSIQIFVLGEAYKPGSYTVSSLSTMMNALVSSGGVTKVGSLRNIQLKRRGKVVATMDLYDLLLRGDTSGDARLLPGDVLFVPTIGKVASVGGEVKRPAIYELKNEKTAQQLLNLAGGLLPNAYPNVAVIERISNTGDRTLLNLDLSKNNQKKTKIQNGDLLKIPSILDRMDNVVILSGHVHRPGGFQWFKGMRVTDLIKNYKELLPNADTSYALISRESFPLRNLEVLPVNIHKALSNPNSQYNLELASRDELFVFGKSEERGEILTEINQRLREQSSGNSLPKLIRIGGNVYFPGEYPLTKGMTAQDLIIAAGGLQDAAYLSKAEITRRNIDNPEVATIEHIDINLSKNDQSGRLFRLKAQDKLAVFTIPEYRENMLITLEGQVRFPGEYEFRQGELLSQVIERAGGFTSTAHLEAAVFTRLDLQIAEQKQLQELKDRMREEIAASELEDVAAGKGGAIKDAEGLLESLANTKALGRLVISLEDIVTNKVADIQLKDGDRLVVPTYRQEISVIGEVQHSASHLFNEHWSLDDYLEKSGGITNRADDSRIYVVKADGSVFLPNQSGWLSHQNELLSPGDTVVVPLDTDRIKSLTLWTNVSQIVYQLALGAAAITRL